jgi:hypothetical protein
MQPVGNGLDSEVAVENSEAKGLTPCGGQDAAKAIEK